MGINYGVTTMRRNKKKYIAIAAFAALVLCSIIGYFVVADSNKVTKPSKVEATKGNATTGIPNDYDDGANSSPSAPPMQSTTTAAPAPKVQTVTLAKPALQKSSGNAPGSSVPSGGAMEFTCESTPGLNCTVFLTDLKKQDHVIDLGTKVITSNGRGQYFAVWPWQAQTGSWQVVAKSTDGKGNSGMSDTQTLEVK